VAWASDEALTEIEGQRPAAIAAVAQWPDDIPTWRSVHRPERIGQVRAEQEAEFDTATVGESTRARPRPSVPPPPSSTRTTPACPLMSAKRWPGRS